MRLELLGTTGYHPNEQRQTACLMLPEQGIVLDAGTGMFRVRERLCTKTLDIFVSHAHLDHIVGLTFLFDILAEKSVERVTVHGAAEKLHAIQTHLLSEHIFPVALPCEFLPLEDRPLQLANGGTLRAFPLDHPGGTLGFRLDWPGHSLAYVTDTTARADASYVEQIRDVDVLVHECYFPDGFEERAQLTGHSCLTPVAQVAAKANVKRCMLVHINPLHSTHEFPGLDAARKIFANLSVGNDGEVCEF